MSHPPIYHGKDFLIYPVETNYLNENENAVAPNCQESLNDILQAIEFHYDLTFKELLDLFLSQGWLGLWSQRED